MLPATSAPISGTLILIDEADRLRMASFGPWVFDFLVFLQKRFAMIAPRMSFKPEGMRTELQELQNWGVMERWSDGVME
jgi:hypothetical protein